MSPLVSLQGVARRYPGGTLALQDLDLAIDRGSFITLLGPSGCGKSTVLRLLAGLDEPSAGRVAWDGGRRPVTGRTGFVFQEPTLMPWASVADNVGLPLKLAGVASQDRASQVDAALQRVGLQGFARALPHELSGGMQMRVSIARGLITKPTLLLLDEPFGALDEISRHKLDDELLSIWAQGGLTVVFVTHSLAEAAYLGTRVCVMGSGPGHIAFEGEAKQPWPRPLHHRTSTEFNQRLRTLQDALAEASATAP